MFGNIKGAIFDMDGTLIDSLIVWDVIWDEFGKRFLKGGKFDIKEKDDKAVRTMTLKDAMYYLNDIYSLAENGETVFEAANQIIADFYANTVELKKGCLNFLEYLYKKGIKMCVASASDLKLVKIAMKHCGIEKYFSDVVSCADMGKGKDEPDVYIKALESLGTSIDDTWVFEDSQVAIKTASALGMKTVGIYDKGNFGHEEIRKTAVYYIDEGETLEKLIRGAN